MGSSAAVIAFLVGGFFETSVYDSEVAMLLYFLMGLSLTKVKKQIPLSLLTMTDLSHIKLAVIGLGYVGLPLAVEFGKKRQVLGFDINKNRIAELQSFNDHTLEVEPEELGDGLYTTNWNIGLY